jgi:maleate isomerase
MYGTRARIGILVPSSNTITEAEFNALKPEGVSVHAARMFITHPTVENLAKMNEDTERAAKLIATAKPSVVAFACTTGSLLEGTGWDARLIERIEKITGVPTTTTSTSVIRAFKELGIQKVSVATPYNEELNRREADFFEKSGVKVLKIQGRDLGGLMAQISLDEVKDLARAVNRPDADAVFLSCTNLKALPVLDSLEKEFGKYVFSSNIATFWDVMRMLKIKEPVQGRGKLLERI